VKYLIAGLGNIGAEYANTRHNIGFVVAEALAQDAETQFKTERYADVAKIKYKARTLVIIKPNTFMNLSGNAIRYWLEKEKIPIENLLIIVDDIALPLGAIRLKAKGGDGGHNGLISIIETLNTTNFSRLRIGVGNDFAKGYQVEYVLGKWTQEEEKQMMERVKLITQAVKSFSSIGLGRTMTIYNNK